MWWFVIGIVVSLAAGLLMKPKIENKKPSQINDFQVPTAEVGRELPVIFGTVHIKGPNVTWYGSLSSMPIQKKM